MKKESPKKRSDKFIFTCSHVMNKCARAAKPPRVSFATVKLCNDCLGGEIGKRFRYLRIVDQGGIRKLSDVK